MKIYGYQKNKEKLIEMDEISILSNIDEFKNLLDYLQDVLNKHSEVANETDMQHSHFKDWNKKSDSEQPDIIIVTQSKNER